MSEDCRYRQRGYQDDRDRDRPKPAAPKGPRPERDGPRTPNLMGSHEVFRCGRCARIRRRKWAWRIAVLSAAPTCTAACSAARSTRDPRSSACRRSRPASAPRTSRNTCTLFAARTTFERQTGSTPAAGPVSAQQAFDDLFKF